MALQQAMFFDLITSMKKATARNDDASDSDESISQSTNRGNKLKRKARYVEEGRLAQADGPRVYKRRLNYNGYTRSVISKTVPRVDPDGDLIDDEENSDPDLSPAEDDPYADVKLEQLLMPLTSAADLDKHPSLSIPYTSRILEDMVQESEDMLHREEAALWRIKRLLVQFRGDDGWAPCGMFEADTDPSLLQSLRTIASAPPSVDLEGVKPAAEIATWDTASEARHILDPQDNAEISTEMPKNDDLDDRLTQADVMKATGDLQPPKADQTISEESDRRGSNANSPALTGDEILPAKPANPEHVDGTTSAAPVADPLSRIMQASDSLSTVPIHVQGEAPALENPQPAAESSIEAQSLNDQQLKASGSGGSANSKGEKGQDDLDITTVQHSGEITMGDAPDQSQDATVETPAPSSTSRHDARPDDSTAMSEGADDEEGNHAHRMTTRARAQANPDAASQAAAEGQANGETAPLVHPFFVAPTETLPYRAQGLRAPLSDEVRIALSAYTQRQEEVVRQCTALLSGLRKALLMKKTVWSWCRNEAHVGEMSDGEDWVDMEEWGLDEPLKKGEEVEDEEVAVGLTKKTRNRRAAA